MGRMNIMKTKRKLVIYYSATALWLVSILYWYYTYFKAIPEIDTSPHSIYDIYDNHYQLPSETSTVEAPANFKQDPNYQMLVEEYNITEKPVDDYHSSVYEEIFKNHNLTTVLANLNFKQRCDLYFRNLFLKNNNWILHPDRNYDVQFGKPYEDFINANLGSIREAYGNEKGTQPADDDGDFVKYKKQKYRELKQGEIDQMVVDDLDALRLYNKCYVTDDDPDQKQRVENFVKEQRKLIVGEETKSQLLKNIEPFEYTKFEKLFNHGQSAHNYDHRIYPWLSFETPVFERWTGQLYNSIPNYREILKDKSQPPPIKTAKSEELNFFKKFKNQCNGKGIVLSIGDQHAVYTVNLIHLLRALGNKLPIQILYHDDISEDTKRALTTAAREDFSDLPESYRKASMYLPNDYLEKESNGLPKQEIWFVNMASVVHENYRDKFRGFANKLLATLFNSFNEFILIDADTAMMQNPEYFFQLKGYQETGSFFFRDRGTLGKRSKNDPPHLHRLAQTSIDKLMFNVDPFSNHTLHQNVFQGVQHSMESGLVVINRQLHFSSIIMIVYLNFVAPIKGKVYGDKELFWLGFAYNGDENYHFNQYGAASIGRLTRPGDRKRPDGTYHHSKELCSPHPGHINEEDGHSLLWINSGFRFCHQSDKINFDEEYVIGDKLAFLEKTPDAYRKFYFSPLIIRDAIIPPLASDYKHRLNGADEPSSGWMMDKYCKNYMWCAYLSVGGKAKNSDEDNTLEGKVIKFTQEEAALFDYYGDVWVGEE